MDCTICVIPILIRELMAISNRQSGASSIDHLSYIDLCIHKFFHANLWQVDGLSAGYVQRCRKDLVSVSVEQYYSHKLL